MPLLLALPSGSLLFALLVSLVLHRRLPMEVPKLQPVQLFVLMLELCCSVSLSLQLVLLHVLALLTVRQRVDVTVVVAVQTTLQ